jgi:hypothetical protein
MKKWIFSLYAICLGIFVSAQDQTIVNDKDAEVRNVSGFHAVRVSGSIDLYISQGPEEVVAISASSQEIKDEIVTEVKDGVLYIHPQKNSNWWRREWNSLGKKIRAYVAASEIDQLSSSGSGSLFCSGVIKADKLELVVSGSGNIDGNLDVGDLSVEQSGSSNVRLKGVVKNSNFRMSGSGNIYSYDLQSDYSDISISGSGNAEITANKEVNASISGSGNIRLKGDAGIRNISTAGSGRIKRV